MVRTRFKTIYQTSLLRVENNPGRLGLLSPTHGQRSKQQWTEKLCINGQITRQLHRLEASTVMGLSTTIFFIFCMTCGLENAHFVSTRFVFRYLLSQERCSRTLIHYHLSAQLQFKTYYHPEPPITLARVSYLNTVGESYGEGLIS